MADNRRANGDAAMNFNRIPTALMCLFIAIPFPALGADKPKTPDLGQNTLSCDPEDFFDNRLLKS